MKRAKPLDSGVRRHDGGFVVPAQAGTQEATHACTVCGALWRHWPDLKLAVAAGASWQLLSATAGACCDNRPMVNAANIVAVTPPPEVST